MAYNKKYAELGESVIDYVNDREDAIEGAFNLAVSGGSNSFGNWIKFSDGTMICYYNHKSTRFDYEVEEGKYNHMDITLPQSFVGDFSVSINGIPYNDNAIPRQVILTAHQLDQKTIRMRGLAIQGCDYIRGFGFVVIGRWK